MRAILALALTGTLAESGALVHGQAPLVVAGRVIAADAGTPIRNAHVVAPPGTMGWQESVRTDAEGRFRIPVPREGVVLRVTKPGFAQAFGTAQSPDGGIVIPMARGAALTIHVVDPALVPRRARVTMTTVRSHDGNAMAFSGRSTDERGILRVGNLGAGEYALGLGGGLAIRLPGPLTTLTKEQLEQAREETARAMAAPGRHSVDLAQMVTLRAGEEASVFLVDLSPPPAVAPDAPPPAAGRGEVVGRVTDEYGDPAHEAIVQLLEPRAGGNGAVMLVLRGATTTDDRGVFRIGAVARGTYYVFTTGERINPGSGHLFFPGRISVAEAQPIDVADGESVMGIDVRLSPSLGERLTGHVTDSTGRALPRATVALRGQDSSGSPVVTRSTVTSPAGQFEFRNVPSGRYTVEVNPRGPVLSQSLLEPQKPVPTPETASVAVRVTRVPAPLTIRTAPAR